MSHPWIKLYCKEWLKEMRSFTPEIRGIWADFLAMAGDEGYGPPGWIKINDDFGLTDAQIFRVISVKKSLFLRAKSLFLVEKMIKVGPENQIEVINFYKYQSEYLRTKQYRDNEKPNQGSDTKFTGVASKSTSDATANATRSATPRGSANATPVDIDIDKEKEIYKEKFGEFKNVLLFPEEYKKLTDKFGEEAVKLKIERMSRYLESGNRRKYKSHYAALLNWFDRDGAAPPAAPDPTVDTHQQRMKEI